MTFGFVSVAKRNVLIETAKRADNAVELRTVLEELTRTEV